jgi:hypothetical protein
MGRRDQLPVRRVPREGGIRRDRRARAREPRRPTEPGRRRNQPRTPRRPWLKAAVGSRGRAGHLPAARWSSQRGERLSDRPRQPCGPAHPALAAALHGQADQGVADARADCHPPMGAFAVNRACCPDPVIVRPYAKTDAALRGAAKLIRSLRAAAAGFRPAITSYRFDPRPPRPGEVIPHGDLGPWNTVYRGQIPVAFINWDSAGRVGPLAIWPQPPGPSCRSRRPGSSPKQDSIRSPAWRPGCERSWTPLARPTGRRSCPSCGGACWMSPNCCAGSKASLQLWPARSTWHQARADPGQQREQSTLASPGALATVRNS